MHAHIHLPDWMERIMVAHWMAGHDWVWVGYQVAPSQMWVVVWRVVVVDWKVVVQMGRVMWWRFDEVVVYWKVVWS